MAAYTLPSGLVVETQEPSFGDELHVVAVGVGNVEDLVYAKCAVIVPGISQEAIAALNRPDGRALVKEVSRIWDGRPEEQEAPFVKRSSKPSKV